MKKFGAVFIAMVLILVFATPVVFAADKTCNDFTTWEEAQKYFEGNSVDGLDEDQDGFVCEQLPGFNPKTEPSQEGDQKKEKSEEKESKQEQSSKQEPEKSKNQTKPKTEKPKEKPSRKTKSEICEVPNPDNFNEIDVDIKQKTAGKVTITAKLKGNQASGTWYLAVGSMDSEAPEFEKEFANIQSTTFTYELNIQNLKNGENLVFVGFEGTVDGEKCSFGAGYAGLIIEDDGTVDPLPEDPNKPSPDKGKEDIEKLKGGKMPKTATSYPISILSGLTLFILGAGMLVTLRRSQA